MKTGLILTISAALVVGSAVGMTERGQAQSAAPSGETIFKQRCAACHSMVKGRPAGVGPNLVGVVGRKAGTLPFNYSPALKKAGPVWSKPNLDRYLAGPAKMVPGTRMAVALPDAKQRAALIAYLEKAK